MKRSISSLASSVLLGAALCVSHSVMAQDKALSTDKDSAFSTESSLLKMDIDTRLATAEAELAKHRKVYQEYFAEAYRQYPAIPAGLLESIAFIQSRWVHLAPSSYLTSHHHLPRAYGVMGLYRGEGFQNQVSQAAQLLRVEEQSILQDAQTNILAAAALLNQRIQDAGKANADLESLVDVISQYAGFSDEKSTIQSYARDNFAYDVLLAIDRGVDANGVNIPERAIDWERAFSLDRLVQLRAPFVRLDAENDRVIIEGYELDPVTETLKNTEAQSDSKAGQADDTQANDGIRSTDYGPALYVQSPYHTTRTASISAVTIHTMQGSYAGTISWFQNNPYSVSAHYLVRSSDGQITQMVREYRRAHHVGVHNSATLGIEHEGYVESGSSWYTTAMYNASSALTRHFCSTYGISCPAAYSGPAHSGVVVLSTSIPIKGHQHFSSNTHVDPGIYWDWSRYHGLLNPGGGGGGGSSQVLDNFESGEGHFYSSPTYSGSTVGISSSSTAQRTCSISYSGNCSEQIKLVDNSSSSSSWSVRFLSGGGSPSNNTSFNRNGRIGFWVYSGGSGMSVAMGIDDSDGTERSDSVSVPANQWTFVEWNLTTSSSWNSWVGGNGSITASNVSIDAIWLFRAQTSYDVYVYIDDVQYTAN